MAEVFVMPKLGLTMEAGTVVSWLVGDGESVSAGQPVLVIETDKVESEVEAVASGVLHQIAQVGDEFACGAQIAWLLAPGEAAPAGDGSVPDMSGSASDDQGGGMAVAGIDAAARGVGARLLSSPNARRVASERGIDLRTVVGSGPGGRIVSEDVPLTAPAGAPASPAVPPTSPAGAPASSAGALATAAGRQLAELLGIDLVQVVPAGPDPRIGRDDVAAHVRRLLAGRQTTEPASAKSAAPTEVPLLQTPTKVTPLRGMRGTIAERMSDSLHSMAQLTLHMDVDMGAVVADRERRKAQTSVVPGFTDYVIAAAAKALVEHPVVNSQITSDGVAELAQINIAMAVALDAGLIVPVVQNAAALALEELAAETTRLATAARAGKLGLTDLEGGTFSVTALGMFDVDGFTPIVNAPNTAILGVGRLRDDVAWTADGRPERATRLTLSLTWDHRAFDGAPAAEFTRTIKTHLESP